MAGEMSREEVTPEAYPWHFAAAEAYGGTVHPFDQYQGPYVYITGRGRFWLIPDEDVMAYWYSEFTEEKSSAFYAFSEGTDESAAHLAQTFRDKCSET